MMRRNDHPLVRCDGSECYEQVFRYPLFGRLVGVGLIVVAIAQGIRWFVLDTDIAPPYARYYALLVLMFALGIYAAFYKKKTRIKICEDFLCESISIIITLSKREHKLSFFDHVLVRYYQPGYTRSAWGRREASRVSLATNKMGQVIEFEMWCEPCGRNKQKYRDLVYQGMDAASKYAYELGRATNMPVIDQRKNMVCE